MSSLNPTATVVIRPSRSWINFDLQGLIAYRDLLWQLVQRDFTAKYKQTVLGPLWFFINPIATTLVFVLVFNRVLGVATAGVPPMLFYLSGMLGWTYFSTVLGGTSNALAGNARLFSKVYFPRLIPPLAMTISAMLSLVIQLATFFDFYWLHHSKADSTLPGPSLVWLLYPLLVVQMGAAGLGVGLILSAMTAKYRDFKHLQGFLLQLWMFATPVIYPLSRIPEKWHWLVNLNPMVSVVEGTREIFLGAGTVTFSTWLISVGMAAGLLLIGLILFQRTARTFVDTV